MLTAIADFVQARRGAPGRGAAEHLMTFPNPSRHSGGTRAEPSGFPRQWFGSRLAQRALGYSVFGSFRQQFIWTIAFLQPIPNRTGDIDEP
jgi:hypothetical protein